jgi:hypothetical protein
MSCLGGICDARAWVDNGVPSTGGPGATRYKSNMFEPADRATGSRATLWVCILFKGTAASELYTPGAAGTAIVRPFTFANRDMYFYLVTVNTMSTGFPLWSDSRHGH